MIEVGLLYNFENFLNVDGHMADGRATHSSQLYGETTDPSFKTLRLFVCYLV